MTWQELADAVLALPDDVRRDEEAVALPPGANPASGRVVVTTLSWSGGAHEQLPVLLTRNPEE